jgi:hypothetical protein
MISFAVPTFAAGLLDSMVMEDGPGLLSLIVMFLFYLVLYTVVIFTNTALVGAAIIRLDGGDPTFRDGWNIAVARINTILGYALISATVGVVLRALSERSGLLGRIIISLVGFVWSMTTFLVVPVLVAENLGPVEAVKRSGALMRRTWGEQLAGNFGISAFFTLLTLALVFLLFLPLMFVAISLDSGLLLIAAFLLLFGGIMALGLFGSALSGIYQAALYRYAVDGEVATFFDEELIRGAFKPKRG